MVRIRLRRTGKKKQPSYRVVVADIEAPRDGRFIENIGFYNPRTDPPTIEIDEERALYWLSQGAQPSDSVATMLRKLGVMAKYEASKHSDVEASEPAVELSGETDA
jgi:small subunit ribosomal protein S16